MSNYLTHAKEEFRLAGWTDEEGNFKDEMQEMICNHVLKLLGVFADEGHSGFSAAYTLNLFDKLAKFNPITAITCADEEWAEITDGKFQNKRLSAVFKDGKDGKPYYIDAVVFREENGSCWTGSCEDISSRQYIKLPFTPKTFYVDVNAWEVKKEDESVKEEGSGWWVSKIKDRRQLGEIFEYYNKYELETCDV